MKVRICSVCNTEKVHEFSYKSGKQNIYKDIDGKHWNGSFCPSCSKQKRLEASRTLKVKARNKEYRQKHKDRYKSYNGVYNREWRQKNPDYFNEWVKNRKKTDPLYKLLVCLRNRLYQSLHGNGWSKDTTCRQYLGCTLEELKLHIEKQWKPGMSWENWSLYGWHIDHIIPLASASSPEAMIKLCHYTNLQPLWAKENLSKQDKLPEELLLQN